MGWIESDDTDYAITDEERREFASIKGEMVHFEEGSEVYPAPVSSAAPTVQPLPYSN